MYRISFIQETPTKVVDRLHVGRESRKFETLVDALAFAASLYRPYYWASYDEAGRKMSEYESVAASQHRVACEKTTALSEAKYRDEVAARTGSRRGFTND